jgi:hypothetical protein
MYTYVSVPIGPIPPGPFNPPFALNTRTPYDTSPPEPPLPANINGVPMQDVVNDPILLLQKEIEVLVADGYTFEGTALNIATTTPVSFLTTTNSGAAGPAVPVVVPQFGGGIENIQFLGGETITVGTQTQVQENAETAVVYATFWIEKVTHKQSGYSFMQLYAASIRANGAAGLPHSPSAARYLCELGMAAYLGGHVEEDLQLRRSELLLRQSWRKDGSAGKPLDRRASGFRIGCSPV